MPARHELIEEWKFLTKKSHGEAVKFYFTTLLPLLEPELLERHRKMAGRYKVLVSLMGFSPETTALCSLILKPERIIVIRSKNVDDSYNVAAQFLVERRIIAHAQLEQVVVDPIDPEAIYKHVRKQLNGERSAVVDVTGGKKLMSATAAQAAWEENIPLCYLQSDNYDPTIRRPLPGSEQLVISDSPSTARATNARREAREMYRSGNYTLAEVAFKRSGEINREDAQDVFGALLCNCYSAWMNLDLKELSKSVEQFATYTTTPRVTELVTFRQLPDAATHIDALRNVAGGQRLALLASYMALAELYCGLGRHDFASLLAYRCHEGLIEEGLKRKAGPTFNMLKPDYKLLGSEAQLKEEFIELSKKVDGDQPDSALPRRIGLMTGFSILCLVDKLHERVYPGMTLSNAVRHLRGITGTRNQSILAHGTQSLGKEHSTNLLKSARELAEVVLANDKVPFDQLLSNLKPLQFSP